MTVPLPLFPVCASRFAPWPCLCLLAIVLLLASALHGTRGCAFRLLLPCLRGVPLCPFFVLRPFLLLRVRSLPLLVFAPWAVVPFRARYAEFGLVPSASDGHSPFSGS